MATPEAPAGAFSVTVPVDELPPVTVDGLSETPMIVPWVFADAALIVRLAVAVFAEVAVMVTEVVFATLEVGPVNEALVRPVPAAPLVGTVAA